MRCFASIVLASALASALLAAGCGDDRVERPVHVRLYVDGVGDFGCAPTRVELPDQIVELACDADGLTMSGVLSLDPDARTIGVIVSDAVDVQDRYLEVPAGYAGGSIWASVRVEEYYRPPVGAPRP
jgi:hypothetical protein